ncbi:DNA (cytosine-5-)-methyltransferase [Hoylesella timonensis CRIS 5C-B1]|uniref:Methyltransferase n=2 Tax=Hoylesella timonensis TaxID=386414 RepID=D1W181_9BACT|nr:DNA methyltransferase [Hoylesella timonensis]EFA96887.1 DNA (cytosine-5-)-methyltransferase [Hoylesella timonensis CRIS 5C-B1]
MDLNCCILGDCIEKMKSIPDGSIDLVIADPPYWKVVGQEWDYQWRTEKDYIEWSLRWIREVARILRIGGTFYCFGYFRTLTLLVPYLDNIGLELRQQIILDKGIRAVSGRATKKYKMFPNVTESILFIIKDNKRFIKPFLKSRQQALNLKAKEINEALGVKSNGGGMWSIYTGKNVCEQFPTEELWNKLSKILQFDLPYNKLAQTFNPQMGYTDVWTDIDFYKEKRYHPTQKPIKLIERLIAASSNEGDIVLDPFFGCGSTQLSCIDLKRNYIAIELDKRYYETALKRIELLNSSLSIF